MDEAAKTTDKVVASYAENLAFAKDNMDALLASGTTVVNGMRDVTKVMLAHVHEQLDANLAYGKAVLAARSIHELLELNQTAAKASMEGLTQTLGKLSERSAKTMEESIAPLAERATAAVDRLINAKPELR